MKKAEILKKHLDYGNPTSIQDWVSPENYVFKEHILKAMNEHARPLIVAMQEFCDRVDKGEVKSKYTYEKFKRLIQEAEE